MLFLLRFFEYVASISLLSIPCDVSGSIGGRSGDLILLLKYQNTTTFQNSVSESNTKMVLLFKTLFLTVIPKLYYFS